MTERPTFTHLVDYVEGRLDPAAAATTARTLESTDVPTERALAWIRTFHDVAGRLPLEAPPVRVRYYLRRQFEAAATRTPPLARLPRRLLAILTFDSRADLAVAGVRSGDTDLSSTSLAFSSDVADVLVDLSPAGDGLLRLDGQMLWADGEASPLLEVRLTGPDFAAEVHDSDDLGRFAFVRVPARVDQLVLHTEDVDIELTWEPSETP